MKQNGWAEPIEAWSRHMKSAGQPDTTREKRVYHLQRLARDMSLGPDEITVDHLEEWFARQNWKPNTRRSYRSSFRAFYYYAMGKGVVTESPAHLLPQVRIPRSRPRPTPELNYRRALHDADERVVLGAMLAGKCGLRRGELARARREHVEEDLLGYSLRVTGKGGHVRIVPLPDDLAEMILARPDGWLFPSKQGGHLTPHYLSKLITRVLSEGGHYTTHTLRHRCGTVAYAATKDLRAVQELLGHAKPETTAIYTLVPDDSIRAAMEAAAA